MLRAHPIDVVLTAIGITLSVWFVDPGGSTIGLLQLEDEEPR